MKKKIALPRGTKDILPEESSAWQAFETKARQVMAIYGYKEIRTPFFEETELFARSMGKTSDVVQKQILQLMSQKQGDADDMAASSLALRPEGTAAVVRSYIENSLDKKERLSKLFYAGPMFRGERPQKGRLRQFHQIGVEAIGPESRSPYLDAEVIALSVALLKSLGVRDLELEINTLGTPEDREKFREALTQKLKGELTHLCEDCRRRFKKNIFRVLDCKNKNCRAVIAKAGIGHEWLSAESSAYYEDVKGALDILGVAYKENMALVRGLDYYTHTVFEVQSPLLESQQNTLCAGGRYDNLVSQLGGTQADAVGFALGVERVMLTAPPVSAGETDGADVYFIAFDKASFTLAFGLLNGLRARGFAGDMAYREGSPKSLMRAADKSRARYTVIIGENERKEKCVTVKDMKTGTEEKVPATPHEHAQFLKYFGERLDQPC